MRKSIFLLLCLIGMASCTDHKDLYNPDNESEKKKEEYDKNFPVSDIDSNQDWSSFTIAKVNVTVNEDWGETYVVKVYTDNPLEQNSRAMLLAKGKVKSGDTFSAEVEIPKALTLVWVARVDSHKRRLVKPAAVVDGKIESAFGTPKGRSIVEGRSTVEVEPLPYSTAQLQKLMSEGTDLSTTTVNNIAAAKGTYYVPAGKTVSWTWNADGDSDSSGFKTGDVKLIIAGTVNYTSSKSIGNGVQVIVAQGGTLNLSADMVFNTNAGMVVMPEANVSGKSNAITFANGTDGKTNYVAGTVDVGTWNNNGGTTYNCGVVNLTNLLGSSDGSTFINSGILNVTGYVGDGSSFMKKIINNCHFAFSGWECNLIDLEMGVSSYLACSALLKTEGGTWKLNEHSMIVAGQFSLNNTNIIGPEGSDYALIRVNNVTYVNFSGSGDWGKDYVITKGYVINSIYFEYNTLVDNLKYVVNETATINQSQKLGNGNVALTGYNQSPAYIPFGTCTKGNIPVEEGDDNDEKEEINAAIYAFEDLGSVGDYDFNDVVFKVSHLSGSTEADVELLAAGGTLKVAVKYGNEVLWDEVHEAFGATTATMINTGKGSGTKTPSIRTITVPAGARFKELNFSIVVTNAADETKTSIVVSKPTTGGVPQCLCIPAIWKWPRENVSIVEAYNTEGHAFGGWAEDSNQAKDWYEYPVSGKVFQ